MHSAVPKMRKLTICKAEVIVNTTCHIYSAILTEQN